MGIEGYLWNPMVHHLSAWRKNHLPGPEVSPDVLHCNALLDVFQQSFEWQPLGMETTITKRVGPSGIGIGSIGQRFDLEIWSWLTMSVLTKVLSGCGPEVSWSFGSPFGSLRYGGDWIWRCHQPPRFSFWYLSETPEAYGPTRLNFEWTHGSTFDGRNQLLNQLRHGESPVTLLVATASWLHFCNGNSCAWVILVLTGTVPYFNNW